MKTPKAFALLALAAAACVPASADTFVFAFTNSHEVVSLITNLGTFTTAQSQFDAGTNNSGWWSPTAGTGTTNDNYITAAPYSGSDHNSFFTFYLPSEGVITSASISAPRGDSGGCCDTTGGTPLILSFFDVFTDVTTLNNNTGPDAGIFNDLGSGTLYGDITVTDLLNPDPLVITLNAAAIAALNARISNDGGYFSFGATVAPVPEPGSLLLLSSVLLAAAGPIRRRLRRS